MSTWYLWLPILALVAVVGSALWRLTSARSRLYERLATLRPSGRDPLESWQPPSPPSFADRLVRMGGILPAPVLDRLTSAIEKLVTTERSYLPAHKKGGTIAYETLCAKAPDVVALYQSKVLRKLVSDIVGLELWPTPLRDQSSCSVLFYEKPGDHIGWHYDHNFYRGRHFTVLIPIVNRGAEPGSLSSAELQVKRGEEVIPIATPPGTLIAFEGARVLHKVTPIAEGERRVVLSMTYCADPRSSAWQGAARRVKDVAFFGVRALWT